MGDVSYTHPWLGVTHTEKYMYAPGETGANGQVVCNYMEQIFNNLSYGQTFNYLLLDGPFQGYKIETWSPLLAEQTDDKVDWNIEHFGGLTLPKQTKINGNFCMEGIYSHEFGHNYAQLCGIYWTDWDKSQIAADLTRWYNILRSQTMNWERPEEVFAEDFRTLFGSANTLNVSNPKVTVQAYSVNGLKYFIQCAFPVHQYLKDKSYVNFNYIDMSKYISWTYNGVLECLYWGHFYRYQNNNWTEFRVN